MKLVVTYKKPLDGIKYTPHDIRNLLGSLTKEIPEVNKVIMWHERKQSPIIYSIPNYRGFAIITYLDTPEIHHVFEVLKTKLQEFATITMKGANVAIKEVFIAKFRYTDFRDGLYERKIRTPLVLGSSKWEYKRARELSKDGKVDMEELKRFTVDTIKESIKFQNRDWFNKEDFEVEDLMLIFKDLEYVVIEYKPKEFYAAVRGVIICNKRLPDFLGYKCGMGYGELQNIKEARRAQ